MISLIGTFVLVHGFSALLPPIPQDERTYYDVLDVPSTASQDDIRKAYRKISLRLHPDKVAQRGGDTDAAREDYQHVQEAYAVLSSQHKRRRYDTVHQSPTQYKFVSSGNMMNPGALYENLSKASLCDKSRLVLLATLLCCLLLLQPILICAKINQDNTIDGSGILSSTTWIVILLPWWIAYGSIVIALAVLMCITQQLLFLVAFLEQCCWFIGEFFIALRWDDTISWRYTIVFIPIYVALFWRWTHKIMRLRHLRHSIERMVTLEYLEEHVLSQEEYGGRRSYQDLTEQELEDIAKEYVVVHVPPISTSQEDDMEMMTEEEKVQSSPEFEHAAEAYTDLVHELIASVIIHTSFVALVVAKVDGAIVNVSWWIVFLPLWIYLGVVILSSMYVMCCMTTIGDEVIVIHNDEDDTDNNGEDDDDAVNNERVEKEVQRDGDDDDGDDDDGYKDRVVDDDFADVEASIKSTSSAAAAQRRPCQPPQPQQSTSSADNIATTTNSNDDDNKKDRTIDSNNDDSNDFANVEASIKSTKQATLLPSPSSADNIGTASSNDDNNKDRTTDSNTDDDFADVEASIKSTTQSPPPSESKATNNDSSSSDKNKKESESKDDLASDVAITAADKTMEQSDDNGTPQQEEISKATGEESKEDQPDVVILEEVSTNDEPPGGIHIDEDVFREFESAYQEAEDSAMEAQAKSQANCCTAIFQLMMLCLIVGKLQQDYMRGPNESPGYNAFWILFPIFLIFGCALCTCACLIYTAGESEGIDHLVERVATTGKDDDDAAAATDETDNAVAKTPSQDENKNNKGGAALASNVESLREDKHATEEQTKEQPKEGATEAEQPAVAQIDDLD